MIDLRNAIIEIETPENENPNKIVDIVEKILEFNNKHQKVKEIKILTPKQMFRRLPIVLAQVTTRNTFENLLYGIRGIIYYLYQEKEFTKQIYNNITNSIKLKNSMDTIFMKSKNNKTSNPHRSLLNLTDKINLKRSDKYVVLLTLIRLGFLRVVFSRGVNLTHPPLLLPTSYFKKSLSNFNTTLCNC